MTREQYGEAVIRAWFKAPKPLLPPEPPPPPKPEPIYPYWYPGIWTGP